MVGSDSVLVAQALEPVCTGVLTALISSKEVSVNILRPVERLQALVEPHHILSYHVLFGCQRLNHLVHILPADISIV